MVRYFVHFRPASLCVPGNPYQALDSCQQIAIQAGLRLSQYILIEHQGLEKRENFTHNETQDFDKDCSPSKSLLLYSPNYKLCNDQYIYDYRHQNEHRISSQSNHKSLKVSHGFYNKTLTKSKLRISWQKYRHA